MLVGYVVPQDVESIYSTYPEVLFQQVMLEYADIILYYSSIVKLTMLGRRASELALRGLRGSQYGLLQ